MTTGRIHSTAFAVAVALAALLLGAIWCEAVTVEIKVGVEGAGAATGGPLKLERVELLFDNGRGEATVPLNGRVGVKAQIKYSGNGILQGKWVVDGRVIQDVNRTLVYGTDIVVTPDEVPPLPTFEPGRHTVTFQVTSPTPSFTIPTLAYFVDSSTAHRGGGDIRLYLPGNGRLLYRNDIAFSWYDPARTGLYQVIVLGEGRSIFSAMTRGLSYRPPLPLLERLIDGGEYTWEVVAVDKTGREAGHSEVRGFKVREDSRRVLIREVRVERPSAAIKRSGTIPSAERYRGSRNLKVSRVVTGGDEVVIVAAVENWRERPARQVVVEFKADGEVISRQVIPVLMPGEYASVSASWRTPVGDSDDRYGNAEIDATMEEYAGIVAIASNMRPSTITVEARSLDVAPDSATVSLATGIPTVTGLDFAGSGAGRAVTGLDFTGTAAVPSGKGVGYGSGAASLTGGGAALAPGGVAGELHGNLDFAGTAGGDVSGRVEYCMGAVGGQCGQFDGIWSSCTPKPTSDPPTGRGSCSVSGGSWLHDSCCFRNLDGFMCEAGPAGDFNKCGNEFLTAINRMTSGLEWEREVDYGRPNSSGIVSFEGYCAPDGSVVHRDDGRYCCSKMTRPYDPVTDSAQLARQKERAKKNMEGVAGVLAETPLAGMMTGISSLLDGDLRVCTAPGEAGSRFAGGGDETYSGLDFAGTMMTAEESHWGLDFSATLAGESHGGLDFSGTLTGESHGGLDFSGTLTGESHGGLDFDGELTILRLGRNDATGVDFTAHALGQNDATGVDFTAHALGKNDATGVDFTAHALGKNDATGVDFTAHALGKNDATGVDFTAHALGKNDATGVDFTAHALGQNDATGVDFTAHALGQNDATGVDFTAHALGQNDATGVDFTAHALGQNDATGVDFTAHKLPSLDFPDVGGADFTGTPFSGFTLDSIELPDLTGADFIGTPHQNWIAGPVRPLKAGEIAIVRSVFGDSLDYSRIMISSRIGFSDRGWTTVSPDPLSLPVRLGDMGDIGIDAPADTLINVLNVGEDAYINGMDGGIQLDLSPDDPNNALRDGAALLIHEVTHAWQSQHGNSGIECMVNSMASQTLSANGVCAYIYQPGKPFGGYGAEQIASMVEDFYRAGASPTGSVGIDTVGDGVVDSHVTQGDLQYIVNTIRSAAVNTPDSANIESLSTPREGCNPPPSGSGASSSLPLPAPAVPVAVTSPAELPGVAALPFTSLSVTAGGLTLTGRRIDVPSFEALSALTGRLILTGRRGESIFEPLSLRSATLSLSGRRIAPILFTPLRVVASGLALSGRRTAGEFTVFFEPLSVTAPLLSLEGRRSAAVAFGPLSASAPMLTLEGRRTARVAFQPLSVSAPGLLLNGRR